MDRARVVSMLNDLLHNPGFIGVSTKADFLITYCVEHGKDPTISVKFVNMLMMNSFTLNSFFMEALGILQKEHSIVTLYSKEDYRLPPNNNRTILSIY